MPLYESPTSAECALLGSPCGHFGDLLVFVGVLRRRFFLCSTRENVRSHSRDRFVFRIGDSLFSFRVFQLLDETGVVRVLFVGIVVRSILDRLQSAVSSNIRVDRRGGEALAEPIFDLVARILGFARAFSSKFVSPVKLVLNGY